MPADKMPEAEYDLSKIDLVQIEQNARELRAQAIRHAGASLRAWVKRRFAPSTAATGKPA